MIDLIQNGEIINSFSQYPKIHTIDGKTIPIADLAKAGNDVEQYGFYRRTRQTVELTPIQKITGYDLQVVDGRPVDVPVVEDKSTEELAQERIDNIQAGILQKAKRNEMSMIGVVSDASALNAQAVSAIIVSAMTATDFTDFKDKLGAMLGTLSGGDPAPLVNRAAKFLQDIQSGEVRLPYTRKPDGFEGVFDSIKEFGGIAADETERYT